MDINELVCKSERCYHGVVARGLCDTHYRVEYRKENPLYITWLNIKQRCYNKSNSSYKYFGAKGIIVCERWRKNYHAFASDMGHRPPHTVLDRIDESGNFTPDNCCWVPKARVKARSRTILKTG